MNVTGLHWWSVKIGLGNGLVPSGQAPSHYLSQCWPRTLLPYVVIRPQWVKATALYISQHQIENNWSSDDECLEPPVIYGTPLRHLKLPLEDVVDWNVYNAPLNGNYINMSGIYASQFAVKILLLSTALPINKIVIEYEINLKYVNVNAYCYHIFSSQPQSILFLPEASIGLRVLSLPVSVCVCVRQSVRQSRACPRDNSWPVSAKITKFGP